MNKLLMSAAFAALIGSFGIAHGSAAFGGLDKQCFKALRKEWSSCNNGSGSSAKLPDFKFEMKSRDNSKNNNGNVSVGSTNNNDPDTGGEDPGTGPDTVSNTGNENSGTEPDTGGEDPGTDTDNSSQPDNNNGGGNNTNPPQSNSNDIKGFDPSTGLYGPGT
jgi:hypothetical protein